MNALRRIVSIWLHVAALCAVVVAQPLFDLIARNPEFLTAHRAGRVEILLVVTGLVILLPTVPAALVWLAGLVSPRARAAALGSVIALLVAMLAMQAAKQAGFNRWTVAVPVALSVGVGAAIAYSLVPAVRAFTTVLSFAVPIVAFVFAFQPPVRRLISPPETHTDRIGRAGQRTMPRERAAPILMVILDEMPLLSLLDGEAKIDPVLYPHLASLAREGTWYRNATTVSDYTVSAVPPIVSGTYPRPKVPPNDVEYPETLFALLARTHRFEVVESLTGLCPRRLCRPHTDPLGGRMSAIASDLRYVYLHVLLTDDLKGGLPDLTADWANFGALGEARQQRREARTRRVRRSPTTVAENFMGWITADDPQPTLYFLDTLLPHFPHELLPSGQANRTLAVLPGVVRPEEWNDDEWATAQHYQRHLLQMMYVDAMVGRIVARLRSVGLYDRALIVVTSDHGISFAPRTQRRAFTEPNANEIMRVPLILKLPADRPRPGFDIELDGQRISDRNVETVDIAPTIADVLGIELPWKADGASMIATSGSERSKKVMYYGSATKTREYDRRGPDLAPALARKTAMFGGPDNYWRVPRPPRFGELVGRRLADLRIRDDGPEVVVDFLEEYARVSPSADAVPFDVGGRIERAGSMNAPIHIAVALNGAVRAVTRTWSSDSTGWQATPPLDAWREGSNELAVLVVEATAGRPVLRRCAIRPGRTN